MKYDALEASNKTDAALCKYFDKTLLFWPSAPALPAPYWGQFLDKIFCIDVPKKFQLILFASLEIIGAKVPYRQTDRQIFDIV